jgi:hypothetical protein
MKPTHPVELIACAIATQEGWFDPSPTVTPRAKNNPGDLRYAGQIGTTIPLHFVPAPIATFDTPAHGIAALFRQVWLQAAGGQTLAQIIAQWAPPNENNTSAYLQNVTAWTGLPQDVPILNLIPPLVQMNDPG